MSVGFADDRAEATCKTCRTLAVDGTLEGLDLEFAGKKNKKSGNASGKPQYTTRQRDFANHPEVNTNPRKAALAVGYSESFAKTQSKALREQLATLIMKNQEAAMRRSAISTARVQSELAAMGFANVLDYFDIDTDGTVTPKQLNQLTREQAAAIQEVEVIPFEDPRTGTTRMIIGKLKLADKRANLVDLGKTLGMFGKLDVKDKREETLLLEQVPTKALEDAEKLLMDAVAASKDQRANNDAIPGEFKVLPGAVESENP